MTTILVLGAHGMLGSMLTRVLQSYPQFAVTAVGRRKRVTSAQERFDVLTDSIATLLDRDDYDWIINAIGVIKPRIDQSDSVSTANAIEVNALFPHHLAAETAKRGQRVIQIATDGVFSGVEGPYDESSPHDAHDVYGKTKSLGETPWPNVVHLRCSVIGPERSSTASLLAWALSSPAGARLPGFLNHRWNGVTTLHFAKLCCAIMSGADVPSGQHVVPSDAITKYELLTLAMSAFGREDVVVHPQSAPHDVDRTLETRDPMANQRLWSGAGYARPPTIDEMLRELAALETVDPPDTA